VIKRVNLEPYFNLTQSGRYSVIAVVKIPEWDEVFSSRPKDINITAGAKLWETNFGVPNGDKANVTPEVRKYVLQQANHIARHSSVLPFDGCGRQRDIQGLNAWKNDFLQPSRPQLDKTSNLHVLFQTSARGFNYSVLTPDGELKMRQSYDYTDTRPILHANENGNVSVSEASAA